MFKFLRTEAKNIAIAKSTKEVASLTVQRTIMVRVFLKISRTSVSFQLMLNCASSTWTSTQDGTVIECRGNSSIMPHKIMSTFLESVNQQLRLLS